MLAVAADNFTVSIVDTGGRKVVRRFRGHTNRITDMVCISVALTPPGHGYT